VAGERGRVLAGCIGDCVHVAGVTRFLDVAAQAGYQTHFTGPATDLESFMDAVTAFDPDVIGVSYRLTPDNARVLIEELRGMLASAGLLGHKRIFFGGTPPVAAIAREAGYFDAVFAGEETPHQIRLALEGVTSAAPTAADFPQTAIERIQWKAPEPILRHHFGIPARSIAPTVEGIARIAESGALDVISLGADQDAQEHFFHPARQNHRSAGAGGVPFRTEDDLRALYEASRRGNYPLLRSYSGTADHIRYAEMLVRTIRNAWCATSLFWFNAMDGRGSSPLEQSIREHQALMAWHGARDIPVEGNESYHWGMRDAPDVVCVVSAYLAAYNAKAFGVKDYIAQLMFNSPPGLSDAMDLAKMAAMLRIIAPLGGEDFHIWRQTRTGLLSYPLQPEAARAHLAASIYLQMALRPHIVHIVGHTEAHHAATGADVVEAARMARRAVENALRGAPDMLADAAVQQRIDVLVQEAQITLEAIRALAKPGVSDPLTDAETLAEVVKRGIMDAPHLRSNRFARGEVHTAFINGACEAVNEKGAEQGEVERLSALI